MKKLTKDGFKDCLRITFFQIDLKRIIILLISASILATISINSGSFVHIKVVAIGIITAFVLAFFDSFEKKGN